MKLYLILLPLVVSFCVICSVECVQQQPQNEYSLEDRDKIIGLRHLEDFLRDFEKKIADWTRSVRDMLVLEKQPNRRNRRQTAEELDPKPPRRFSDLLVVQDIVEGVKFLRKQLSDFIDRASRFITGDHNQGFFRQASSSSGPYVPFVKELREYLILLQRRLTVWSKAVEKVFQRSTVEPPILVAQ